MKNETSINNFFLRDGQTALPKFTHGSLFSGIGGFDLAAQWTGWENVFQCEIDNYCQKILTKNFPSVKRFGDIKEFDGTQYTNRIDILSGGFPCQPFSIAGHRKGKEDARHLWPEMFRVIKEIRPTWIVGENVTGIIGLALEQVLSDLESAGYHTETFIIPACAVGALHKRDRLWIVAHTDRKRWKDEQKENGKSLRDRKRNDKTQEQSRKFEQCGISEPSTILSNTESIGREQPWNTRNRRTGFDVIEGRNYWQVEPAVGRVANGIPNRVDRIRGLGNAIVPQLAFQIFSAIDFVLRGKEKKIINTVSTAQTNL